MLLFYSDVFFQIIKKVQLDMLEYFGKKGFFIDNKDDKKEKIIYYIIIRYFIQIRPRILF